MDIKEKMYNKLLEKYGITDLDMCSDEECQQFQKDVEEGKPLPEGVFQSEVSQVVFYRKAKKPTTEEAEKIFYAGLCKDMKTIKNCIVFFTTLTVIDLIASFILFIKFLSIFD